MIIIAPSLLAANWKNINKEITQITHPNAQWIHFDVMDGKFVKATTYTPKQLHNITLRHPDFHYDVHLMVENVKKSSSQFAKAGAHSITFHYEAVSNHKKTINYIKDLGCKVGISIKPSTPVSKILHLLEEVDIVLVMSVEPGKGGQDFIKTSLEKIKLLAKQSKEKGFVIQVDGGIKGHNAKEVILAGADVLVAGSYIFSSSNYNDAVEKLMNSNK